ncbi:hypothetical protein ACEPAF_9068 [Sanghuangporus sanghuang]
MVATSFTPSLTALSNLHSRTMVDNLDIVKQLISQTQTLQCGQFATLALIVYDIIVTVDKEATAHSASSEKVLILPRTSIFININR